MKNLIAVIFVLAGFACQAQKNENHIQSHSGKLSNLPPMVIDGVTNANKYFQYLDPKNIDSISIEQKWKDSLYSKGVIIIKLKEHNKLSVLMNDRWLSLKEVAAKNIPVADKDKVVLFMINDKLITDTTNVTIPSNRLHKVTLVTSPDMPYFKTTLPNVQVLRISTEYPEINIRGSVTDMPPSPIKLN